MFSLSQWMSLRKNHESVAFKRISLRIVSCFNTYKCTSHSPKGNLGTHLSSNLFYANLTLKLASKNLNLPSATNQDDSIHKPNLWKQVFFFFFFFLYTLHGWEIQSPLALATVSIIEVRGLGLGSCDLSSSLMRYDTANILKLCNITSCSCDARNLRSWGAQN